MLDWTAHDTPFTGWAGTRGCYASDRDEYVAVAVTSDNEVVATSPDAITWTGRASAFDGASCNAVVRCLSLGLYIAAGSNAFSDYIQTSPDGATWTGRGNPFGSAGSGGLSVAVKEGGTPVVMAGGEFFDQPLAVSNDGISWSSLTSPFDSTDDLNRVKGIAYSVSEDRWMAVGDAEGQVATVAYSDDDGATWTTASTPMDGYGVQDVYRDEDAGNWYIMGYTAGAEVLAVSSDGGSSWSAITSPLDSGFGYGFVASAGVLVFVGYDGAATATIVESSDGGATWTTDTSPFDPAGTGYGVFASASVFVAVGSNADNTVTLASTVIGPPLPVTWAPGRRVGVAFDDGPREPHPTWTWLDGEDFPDQFVAGYNTDVGRQTLISQTDTGTATVYINDHELALFDDRNLSSPYRGKLSGRQICLQLWNPVTETWERQFRGIIDDYRYDIDGSAVDANGDPINASIQLECVDMFDYLNGYGLTPGVDGVTPPTGMEDGVWYAPTAGSVQDRFLAILGNAGIDPDMYVVASGNVKVIGAKYDPDESALTALRDAADAELPFIANIYVDRFGRFVFRGRYSRFVPDDVAAGPGEWDFHRWPLGDGKAIQADPTRGQIRVLSYSRSRQDLINAALAYPQGIDAADIPGQVYAAAGSIALYGKHQAAPMSDLLTGDYVGPGTITPDNGTKQCALYAQLLVENKKAPRIAITALQLKAMRPDDPRAEATWGAICGADISHIVNVAVGYPGGTGLAGDSPDDDYYVEGRSLVVRPLNPTHDYVECNLDVTPAVWSMDESGVFPEYGS